MASDSAIRSGPTGVLIAIVLFVLVYILSIFVLSAAGNSTVLAIPVWYWLSLVIGAVLWVLFYFIAQNMNQFYELMGVR